MAIQNLYPAIRPSLDLNFAGSKTVDPRITFTRGSSATYFDEFGVMRTSSNNVPRIAHSPLTGECLGLLIEEQRTNLLTYSEQFDNAVWTRDTATITANAVVAPDGTLTADKLFETASTGVHRFLRATPISAATTYTASVYVKAAERRYFGMKTGVAGEAPPVFDLLDGNVVTGDGAIVDVGDGWYRCSCTFSSGESTLHYAHWTILINPTFSGEVYTGDGTSGVYIWGAQLEVGAFPTSYIKTEASQVTRSADRANMTGANFSSWYRRDEWTLFAEFSITSTNTQRTIAKFEGTSSQISLLVQNDGRSWGGWFNIGDVTSTYSYTKDKIEKAAILFSNNPFQYSIVAGGTVGSSGNALSLNVANAYQLRIGNFSDAPNARLLNGYIRKLAFYPARLTNTQLQTLTS